MPEVVLMIDDDESLVRLTELSLTQEGYAFTSAPNGIGGLQRVEQDRPSVILLDVSMPKLDGWETCRLLREVTDVPIIMLTARGEETDKARGLDAGADDYLTKPFGFVELTARIRAALRRADMPRRRTFQREDSVYRAGGLVVDVPAHSVTLRGQPVILTPIEFKILAQLFQHRGLVLTHRQLLTSVWGFAYADESDLLKPPISRLRQKIEDDPHHPQLIQTVHGVGYRLTAAD